MSTQSSTCSSSRPACGWVRRFRLRDWWLWNQLPVTLGNLVGGFLFVGLPMLWLRGAAHPQSSAATPSQRPQNRFRRLNPKQSEA